jgi:hypothetical protein
MDWLQSDLRTARALNSFIVGGMHKPPAYTCAGKHSMEEDGSQAIEDSERVLDLLAGTNELGRPVDALFVSHDHHFAEFAERRGDRRIRTYLTGGLGAHLKPCTCSDCEPIHHVLELDVGDRLEVSVLQWPGTDPGVSESETDEDDEKDSGETLWDLRCAR